MAREIREDRVSHRMISLLDSETEAVMAEATNQLLCRDHDDIDIQDFIENALDMLESGEYEVEGEPGPQNRPRHFKLVHK